MSKQKREWNVCATCGNDLNTGWECDACGLDWMPFAYPWWRRMLGNIKSWARLS